MKIAFDIGNVLIKFDIFKFVNILAEELEISKSAAMFFLEHVQTNQDIGLTTIEKSLRLQYNISKNWALDLVDEWNHCLEPSELMLRFVENLQYEGVDIALLSNMGKEHADYLRKTCPEIFNHTVPHLSFEVGARKPTKLFYQSFCMDHDDFTGALYLDDIEENLQTGKKYGFSTYLFNLSDLLDQSLSAQKKELDRIKGIVLRKAVI